MKLLNKYLLLSLLFVIFALVLSPLALRSRDYYIEKKTVTEELHDYLSVYSPVKTWYPNIYKGYACGNVAITSLSNLDSDNISLENVTSKNLNHYLVVFDSGDRVFLIDENNDRVQLFPNNEFKNYLDYHLLVDEELLYRHLFKIYESLNKKFSKFMISDGGEFYRQYYCDSDFFFSWEK